MGIRKRSQQLVQAAQFFFRKRAEFLGTVLENKDPECPSHHCTTAGARFCWFFFHCYQCVPFSNQDFTFSQSSSSFKMTFHKERLNARRTRAFYKKKKINQKDISYSEQNPEFSKKFQDRFASTAISVVPFIYPVNSLGKKQSLSGDRCIAFLRCV